MVDVPEAIRHTLEKAAEDLDLAAVGLSEPKVRVIEVPKHSVGQLRSAAGIMRHLAAGEFDRYGYDIVTVGTHLGLASRYLVIWAESGFK